MSTTYAPTGSGRPGAPAAPAVGKPRRPPTAAGAGDNWPHTNRLLPWMLAAFVVMVWLVPFDSVQANVSLPIDLKLDRIGILLLSVVWLLSLATRGSSPLRWRGGAIDIALVAFAGVAVASVLVNAAVLANLGTLDLATKRLSVLISYVLFFFIASTSLRPQEIPRFVKLIVALSGVTAAGLIYERYTGSNPFFDLAHSYLPGGAFKINPTPTANSHFARAQISGPARHGLAAASMLAMALPFTIVQAQRARNFTRRAAYTLLAGLIVWGAFATARKTSDFGIAAALLTMIALRPRTMLRFAPIVAVSIGVAWFVHPAAVTTQVHKIAPSQTAHTDSSTHRSQAYGVVTYDLREHAVLGRGFGSYDPDQPQHYRTLDNGYLGIWIETGLLGLGAFAALLLAVGAAAWRAVRSHDPQRSDAAFAAVAATVVVAVVTGLFDSFGFGQVPYLFVFMAAVVVVTRPHPRALGAATATALSAPVAALGRMLTPRPAGAAELRRPPRRRSIVERPRHGAPFRRRAAEQWAPRPEPAPRRGAARRRAGRDVALATAGALASRTHSAAAQIGRTRLTKGTASVAALVVALAVLGSGQGLPGLGRSLLGLVPGDPFGVLGSPPPNPGKRPLLLASLPARSGSLQGLAGGGPALRPSLPPAGTVRPGPRLNPTPPPTVRRRPPVSRPAPPPRPVRNVPAPTPRPGGPPQSAPPPTTPGPPPPVVPGQAPQPNCLPAAAPTVLNTILAQLGIQSCRLLPAGAAGGPSVAGFEAIVAALQRSVAVGMLRTDQYNALIADFAYYYNVATQPASAAAAQPPAAGPAAGAAAATAGGVANAAASTASVASTALPGTMR